MPSADLNPIPRLHRLLLNAALALCLTVALALPDPCWAAASVASNSRCAAISRTEVEQLFDRWNTALASGDPEQVAALYSDDALLLPTLSDQPRDTHTAIRDYFAGFLTRSPQGRIDSRRISLGCNQALDAGTYSFLLENPEGGEPTWVQARYSFVYTHAGDRWRILHHHSSLQPS